MTTFNKIKKTIINNKQKKTKQLIRLAQETIEKGSKPIKNDLMEYIAKGICPSCKKDFFVIHWKNSDERAKYELICGCTILVNKTGESISKSGAGYEARYSRIGAEDISSTHDGKAIKKENDEVAVTHIFLEAAYPHFKKVKSNKVQNSPVDTIAYNDDEEIFIQVTKLYKGKFWEKLNTQGEADINNLNIEVIIKLIKNALERKFNVDKEQKKQIVLLISCWPGIHDKYFDQITQAINEYASKTGYKEIWLVGAVPDLTIKIF